MSAHTCASSTVHLGRDGRYLKAIGWRQPFPHQFDFPLELLSGYRLALGVEERLLGQTGTVTFPKQCYTHYKNQALGVKCVRLLGTALLN
jgi:hypothetical protein